jgi:AsmA protein
MAGCATPSRPYTLRLSGRIGSTQLQARGTITGLPRVAALDMAVEWRGDNQTALAPILQLPLPPTPAYRSAGRLVREGSVWRYDSFTGQVGRSDVAGTLQLDTASPTPMLRGGLSSRLTSATELARDSSTSAAYCRVISSRSPTAAAISRRPWLCSLLLWAMARSLSDP